jgi:hypothetical protein
LPKPVQLPHGDLHDPIGLRALSPLVVTSTMANR